MIKICSALAVLALFTLASIAHADGTDWRNHIIPSEERTFDFKTVAKGATPEHQFILKNPFLEPIHIGAITASCVCTTLHFDTEKLVLKTYEEIIITVRLRGDLYDGQRSSTLTVLIDQPSRTEIQLNVRGDIRADLNISPQNVIDFGNVELSQEHARQLTVTYTGRNPQWRLLDALCENNFIRTAVSNETARSGARIFRVDVSIDESAPHGPINSHLILISNDTGARREIPIAVRATVGTVIRVSPPSLFLGVLSPGEASPRRNVMLSGTQPFRIEKIESDNPAIEVFLAADADALPQLRHFIPIAYKNPLEGEGSPENGVMRSAVRITTDVPGLTSMFYVTASIRPEGAE
ncbi:MAG: DUF1573 domain-containing protein [Planctomycetaceae bacterium]|nr:DUF1573 domain-containing protein [Planctomycetaceae bacterium]